ncbi:MAG: hypothetical protein RI885_2286 [Actinomycetota bacterium]|jgi:hypothetical protein
MRAAVPQLGVRQRRAKVQSVRQVEEQAAIRMVHFTSYLPADLVEEIRNAAAFLAGPPLHLNLSRLMIDAATAHLAKLRKSQNAGRPFPERPEPLKHGRRRRVASGG